MAHGSASKSPKLVELAGEAAEGVIGTYPTFSQETPQYKAFKAASDQYPDKKIPVFGEYNYDMVKLTAKAPEWPNPLTPMISPGHDQRRKRVHGRHRSKTFNENSDVGTVSALDG